MLNKWLYILSIVILLSGFQTVSAETKEQRIQFAKGKTSTVVKGVTGESGVYYTVRAKSGQKLVFELTPSANIGIKIEADRSYGHTVLLDEKKGGYYDEVGIDETGDCTIFVGSLDHKSTPFKLSIKIEKLADI